MKTRNTVLHILLAASLLHTSGCSLFGKSDKSKKDKYGSESAMSENDLAAQRENRFGGGSIPMAEGEGMFRDVRFDYDSSTVSDEAHQDIESNVQTLRSNPGLRVQLEGHTDERGTGEYNLSLGQTRARAVKDILVAAGIESSRIDTISYGENVPLDPGHQEAAWSRNRRVHFSPIGGGEGRGAAAY
jgi:peptidoglycan-associated lipoprotein